MTAPSPTPPTKSGSSPHLLRIAIWVAIGALIAAAIVCVVMVLVGSANGIIGRAFLTILLLAAFAGVALLDARLAPRRPTWFALLSMVVWVVTLLIGAVMIWMPERRFFDDIYYGTGFGRFFSFLLIVLILQLAVLHVRLYTKAIARRRSTFTNVVGWVTIGLVGLLAIMLVFPLMLNEWIRFHDIYWRITVAVAILAAVGTALVPLVNALFAPRAPHAAAPQGWPTYADGVTPLPVLHDGSPDWNAYYTGYPTAQVPVSPVAQQWQAPQAPWQTPPAEQWSAPQNGQQWSAPAPQHWPAAPQPPAPQPAAPAPQTGQQWSAPAQPPQPQWPTPTPQQWPAPGSQQQWPAPGPEQQWSPPAQPADPHGGQQGHTAPGHEGYPPPPPLPPQH